jgi:phage terminase large subunit-like protein
MVGERAPEWTTACPDWADRIVARQSLVACPPLYPDQAAEALRIFRSLQMTDLPMKRDGTWPTMGEVCEPFVFDLVAALFGSQDPLTGTSRVKEAMLLISKKNGKSTIAAAVMLTALSLNFRHGAELLVLAPTIEIANNSFSPAAKMVRADPEMAAVMKVIDHQRIIRHLGNEAELKIVAADAGVVGGKKAGFVLVDELWLFGKKAGAESMLEEATGGQAARPEGWTLYLSTHSDEPPAGVFRSKLQYFRDVRDGAIDDPTTLPMLYEWPEAMIEAKAYLDPAMYYVTNPNLGKSPTVEFIQRKIVQAQSGEGTDGDTTIQIVLAKYLNVEIGMRLHRDRWRGADYWMDAALPEGLSLPALLRSCDVVTVGIDGGGLDDLFGMAVLGRESGSDRWLAWAHAWCIRSALKVHKKNEPLLKTYQAAGDLTVTETTDQIVKQIAGKLVDIRESGLLPAEQAIGVDPADIGALIDALVAEGFRTHDEDGSRLGHIEPVRQGVGLTSAIHTAEFKLHDGLLVHGGSEMMAWCVSNAKAVQKGNSVAIDKEVAGSGKIDPLIALLCAVKLMELGPVAATGPSVYEDRGLVLL